MDLHVIGCHGGETPKHRTSAFVLDGRLAIDAGSLTSGLDVKDQCAIEAVLVSHAHLDHVRDLATIADNRAQANCPPLLICGTKGTIAILKKHFFNDLLWPDFTKIPSARRPTIAYLALRPEVPVIIAGYTVKAILVDHTIETCAFAITASAVRPRAVKIGRTPAGSLAGTKAAVKRRDSARAAEVETPGGGGSILYSGDTGPTERLWTVANAIPDLRAVLMEVSFPNEAQAVATASAHHTPQTLAREILKLKKHKDIPYLLYHIKPVFQREVERECARIKGASLTVLKLGDRFLL